MLMEENMDGSISSATTTMFNTSKNSKRQGAASGGSISTVAAAMRKGPWTEEEDAQLVWFVRLFGERRWDFLAKVSGLKRTGKSCRLRWVNYLHPGLRRGRITADEERLILELHAKWGSRWSRIARSLPGRTDNEIKNFWRTRTRKQRAALAGCKDDADKSTTASASPSSSSSVTTAFFSVSPNSSSTVTESVKQESGGDNDDAELDEASTTTTTTTTTLAAGQHHQHHQQQEISYTMDQLWNEIAAAEAAASYDVMDSWGIVNEPPPVMPSSPVWEFCSDYSLWRIDDEEYYKKMLDAS